jgi:hypothetical protein
MLGCSVAVWIKAFCIHAGMDLHVLRCIIRYVAPDVPYHDLLRLFIEGEINPH